MNIFKPSKPHHHVVQHVDVYGASCIHTTTQHKYTMLHHHNMVGWDLYKAHVARCACDKLGLTQPLSLSILTAPADSVKHVDSTYGLKKAF